MTVYLLFTQLMDLKVSGGRVLCGGQAGSNWWRTSTGPLAPLAKSFAIQYLISPSVTKDDEQNVRALARWARLEGPTRRVENMTLGDG